MATEGCNWNNLPSVILVEVFSYLSQEDKIRASSTCKQWRCALYHPSFWQSIHFKVRTKDQNSLSRTRYLTNTFAKKLRNATVSFDSMDPLCVQEAARVLHKLCSNDHLKRLVLIPSHCRFECPGRNERRQFFKKQILKPMKILMEHCQRLEALSLGCSEELAVYVAAFMEVLASNQASSMRHLGLASVKDDPDDYLLLDLDASLFRSFQMLQVLSVDYDYVNDGFLGALGNADLLRLIIHVHGLEENHPGTTNAAWDTFKQNNVHCELRLTLIHSYEAVEVLHSEILKPSMPLTHLKAFFCEQLNSGALHFLSNWYGQSMQSVWWVDSFGSPSARCLIESSADEPDPLVMMAWRCSKLEEIVLLGYKYYVDYLVAIARLRGHSLKTLDIAAHDVVYEMDDDLFYEKLDLQFEVGELLGKVWEPIPDSQLHDVIHNPTAGDSDEFILPIVLRDQDL